VTQAERALLDVVIPGASADQVEWNRRAEADRRAAARFKAYDPQAPLVLDREAFLADEKPAVGGQKILNGLAEAIEYSRTTPPSDC